MNKMKFNSQICTSREQSEKLLALGLKKETADMIHVDYGGRNYMIRPYDWLPTSKVDMEKYIPAWSLHRLIQIYRMRTIEFEKAEEIDHLYEILIKAIEIAVERGIHSKEYFNHEV